MHSDDFGTTRPFVFNPSKIRPPQSIRPLNLASTLNNTRSLNHNSVAPSTRPLNLSSALNNTRPLNHNNPLNARPLNNTPRQSNYFDNSHNNKSNDFGFRVDVFGFPDDLPRNSPNVEFSDKSVIIHDSSDDEFSADIELPTDILEPTNITLDNSGNQQQHEQQPLEQQQQQQPEQDNTLPFDAALDVPQAVAIIKETQEHFARLSQNATELLEDMEAMINVYGHAIERAVQSQTQYKELLIGQWERTKRNSQLLLESAKNINNNL